MNPLVVYFSATGITAGAANALAKAVNGELYEIRPAVPYTVADLDWRNTGSRSSVEARDKDSRPALSDTDAPVAGHDIVFLGFPIWWYRAPTIINSFLEAYDFSGKHIILFATSGGSGLGNAAEDLRRSAPGAKILNGRMMNGKLSEAELKAWVSGLVL